MFFSDIKDSIEALKYLGKIFPNFNIEKFEASIKQDQNTIFKMEGVEQNEITKFIYKSKSMEYFSFPENEDIDNYGIVTKLCYFSQEQVENILNYFNLDRTSYSENDKKILRLIIKDRIKNIA